MAAIKTSLINRIKIMARDGAEARGNRGRALILALSFVTKREPKKWSRLRVDHPEVEPVTPELTLRITRAELVSSCLIRLRTLAPNLRRLSQPGS